MNKRLKNQLEASRRLKGTLEHLRDDYKGLKANVIRYDKSKLDTIEVCDNMIKECERIIRYYNNRIGDLQELEED